MSLWEERCGLEPGEMVRRILKFKNITCSMDLTDTKRPKRIVEVIEPNTTRVIEARQKRQEEERIRAEKEEQERQQRLQNELKMKSMQSMLEKQKLLRQKELEEEELRRIEEENESNKLSGKFGHIINDLTTHSSNLEFTISGLDLRPAQIKVLVNNVENNSSLKALSMPRKKLTDPEGKEICEKLEKNQTLERLELEGNQLGPLTLRALAKLLKVNETIRYIDLERNSLVLEGSGKHDYQAVQEFAEALCHNETLLYINLNSTGLDSTCSRIMREIFEHNTTLILLDLENNNGSADNPGMALEDVLYMQDKLVANKQIHDEERYKEFIERKRMRREEDISGVLLLNEQTRKLRQEAIELNTHAKKRQLDDEWDDFLKKQELLKAKMIAKLEKEAKTKGGKKKKKPKPAKK